MFGLTVIVMLFVILSNRIWLPATTVHVCEDGLDSTARQTSMSVLQPLVGMEELALWANKMVTIINKAGGAWSTVFHAGSNRLLCLSLCSWLLWHKLWDWQWWVRFQPLQQWCSLHSEFCILSASISKLGDVLGTRLLDSLCWEFLVQMEGEVA